MRSGIRLITVCAGIAGAGVAAAAPAVAAEAPASVGAPVVSNLNSTGLLGGQQNQGDGKGQPGSPLPVGGGLLGGLPAGGLPLGG
ncbi:hypothetical protein ACFPM3_18960 [Streptomyces coeruleoprunus]|uniref:ATP-binding protein n=1 Tax=Streptomyces coeruleoprunus TaxID=285563 RepID=A0ABV9XID2_9ACTN